jgi:Predicted Zn-dependent protease (DUF2268)
MAFILVLGSCQSKSKEDDIIVAFEHPETGQPFEIVHAYKLYDGYIEKATSEQTDEERMELYKSEIIDPVYEACFHDGEYLYMVDSLLEEAPIHLNTLSNLIDTIDPDATNAAIKEALIRSSDLLPTEGKTTVCIFPNIDIKVKPKMVTAGAGKIIVLYNKYYELDPMKATIAHEYHHSVWAEKYHTNSDSVTVLDNIVFEGKAVMMEKLAYPELTSTPVDPDFNKSNWEKIAGHLETVSLEKSLEILRGGGDLPPLYGYSEGYKMVKAYLEKHPGLEPKDWLGISEDEIFKEGDYGSNYE